MRIDPEFRDLIPPLTDAEREALEASLVAEGCREALCAWQGLLVDGHHRYEICTRLKIDYQVRELRFADRSAALEWIVENQLARRNLSTIQRIELIRRQAEIIEARARERQLATLKTGKQKPPVVANLPPREKSRDELGKLAGVGGRTWDKAIRVLDLASDSIKAALRAGELTIDAAYGQLRRQGQAALEAIEFEAAVQEIRADAKERLTSVCDLRVATCRDLFASGIRPDAVITDPPYPREFLPAFSELAEACKAVPLVAVMTGQTYLPEVIQRLCEHLVYRWTLAYLTPGGQASQQFPVKVNSAWKPVLVFGEDCEWLGDVATSKVNDNDKRFHDWGQSESGIGDLIERLTKPGQLVCDPFVGGGTTAVAALRLGRRFVGCDIDADAVETARGRALLCLP